MTSIVATSTCATTSDLEGQPNNTRFKVVKIDGQRAIAGKSHPKGAEDGQVHDHILMPNGQKSFTYKRGRWTVTDFYDPPVVASVLSNPSSNSNSSPSTPVLNTSLNPLVNRLVITSQPDSGIGEGLSCAPTSGQPPSPPAFEDIPSHPLASGNISDAKEVSVPTTLASAGPVDSIASAVPLAEVLSARTESDSAPDMSLTLVAANSSPDQGKKSRPDSGTSSHSSPADSDLASLVTVIAAHSGVNTIPLPAVLESEARVDGRGGEELVRTIMTGIEAECKSSNGAVGGSVAAGATIEPVSGYATPASIHSVTGANASSILPPYVSSVAIDNKIEQAMDLVKSHLMFAVREEVDVLKEKIVGLLERIQALETENAILKQSHESQSDNQRKESVSRNTSASHSSSPVNTTDSAAQELACLVSDVMSSPESVESSADAAPAVESPLSPEESK